ncbi:MAG: hypothetical protein RLY97_844 [Pseudomonadota bacterium]|jgi:hypothetical protein
MNESHGDFHRDDFVIQAAGWVLEASGYDETLFYGFARPCCVACFGW